MEVSVYDNRKSRCCEAGRRNGDWTDFPPSCGINAGCRWKVKVCRLRLKRDGTRWETRFRLSAKQTSPFKSAGGGASVQSTTGSRGVRISGSNAGYTMFRGSVKSTGYPLHSPVFPSLPLPCVTVCHHISTGLYTQMHELGLLAGNRPELISSLVTRCSKIGVNTAAFSILTTVLVCVLHRIILALCNMMGKKVCFVS
jgi:hypothetical protein